MTPPLLDLCDVERHYRAGETVVRALDGTSLRIERGEFVAIMGQSGSGKSTLMNIIGCLDRPTAGSYRVLGKDVASLSANELASLRRDTFGFVFQRYNLLPGASAAENVEIPSVYAGTSKRARVARVRHLLLRLGLSDRADHRPPELSGGQQQRVAIARALVNDPPVILADEPTGALDRKSGEEVLALLRELHLEGRTIILITHAESVAQHATRIVQIQDGKIFEHPDHTRADAPELGAVPGRQHGVPPGARHPVRWSQSAGEALRSAARSLRANLFRTALTLLGIVIGVAAVVAMLAVGEGTRDLIMQQIGAMGTNLIMVRPGAPGARGLSGDLSTLVPSDATAIAALPNVESVTAERSGRITARHGNIDSRVLVQGVGEDFPQARDWPVAQGQFFGREDQQRYAPVAVLGSTAARALFQDGKDPIGQYVLLRNVPFQVIGILTEKGAAPGGQDQDDAIFVPVNTALVRLFGKQFLNGVTVKIVDAESIDDTQADIEALLRARHGTEDFNVRNMASILSTALQIQGIFTLLLGTVAAISLIVGGIGVMNIMLVSVVERTREIGIRMATGARTLDIALQFNIEAAVVCGVGGVLGIALGMGAALALRSAGMPISLSASPAITAFGCACATGLAFGYLPARKASRLDPVQALASE